MFRTELPDIPSKIKINLQNSILLMGSCFSDNIGEILLANKFDALPNPFGVVYNPISIFNLLENSLLKKNYQDNSFVQQHEIWYNYHIHSEISGLTKEDLNEKIMEKSTILAKHLESKQATLILTFGTAFVYSLKENNEIVANCHKISSHFFEKQLLSTEQIIKAFEKLYNILPKDLHIILTVSPVRHIKDTIPLNSVSKAVLRLSCHQLAEQFSNVSYFPAFEYVIDDLRDYRFYEADMLHPNKQAIDYVFAKFSDTYFDTFTQVFLGKWEKIYKSLQHKPFYAQTKAHQIFLKKLLSALTSIKEVDVSAEIAAVEKQLILSS